MPKQTEILSKSEKFVPRIGPDKGESYLKKEKVVPNVYNIFYYHINPI
jgi:hypothetical protein